MSLEYNKNLIPRAKELRKYMTPQERHLWYDYLAKYPIRFQRQKAIDNYITDFYCHTAKLVVEIDGGQHFTSDGMAYDEERTKVLESYGLQVIRFSNDDIDRRFPFVCQQIDKLCKDKQPVSPSVTS